MHTFDYRIRILSLVSGLVNTILHILQYVSLGMPSGAKEKSTDEKREENCTRDTTDDNNK